MSGHCHIHGVTSACIDSPFSFLLNGTSPQNVCPEIYNVRNIQLQGIYLQFVGWEQKGLSIPGCLVCVGLVLVLSGGGGGDGCGGGGGLVGSG